MVLAVLDFLKMGLKNNLGNKMTDQNKKMFQKINWTTVRDTALSFLTVTGYQIYIIRRENDLRDAQRKIENDLMDKQRQLENEQRKIENDLRDRALKAKILLEHKHHLDEIRAERRGWFWQLD